MFKQIPCCIVSILLLVTVLGCGSNQTANLSASESKEFREFLDASLEELSAKTEANEAWGLGTFDGWNLDQETGMLKFSNADGTEAVAPAQIIGSFSTNDNTWLWAWDNPSILDSLKADSLKVKEYGETNNVERLTTRKWTGTEKDAWTMAALAAKLCESQGVYRGPTGSSYVFITFGDVQLSKPQSETE
ncbi:hypothetical protein Mal52_16380 [Symmachiella dynata]|uniref:Lipoprotein n=1 Tax=Symmachiella dynata TaxID=2527995 RepID=A0A517ZL29_9PLAN|nr:DUF6882 domain-containing protein [Symmachiella dynata]QDU43166.1 hypothetical protein Mal52_16380 [Symmachiella dynata]